MLPHDSSGYDMSAFGRSLARRLTAVTWQPEFNVMLFAFLLNYPWEFMQVPLFEGMADQPHWEAVKVCTRAALGDAVIMLIAYWAVAVLRRSRAWIAAPGRRSMWILRSIGVFIAVIIEWLALHGWWLASWRYSTAMPIVPGLGVGLVPVLQWVVVPSLVTALVGRVLRGRGT